RADAGADPDAMEVALVDLDPDGQDGVAIRWPGNTDLRVPEDVEAEEVTLAAKQGLPTEDIALPEHEHAPHDGRFNALGAGDLEFAKACDRPGYQLVLDADSVRIVGVDDVIGECVGARMSAVGQPTYQSI